MTFFFVNFSEKPTTEDKDLRVVKNAVQGQGTFHICEKNANHCHKFNISTTKIQHGLLNQNNLNKNKTILYKYQQDVHLL